MSSFQEYGSWLVELYTIGIGAEFLTMLSVDKLNTDAVQFFEVYIRYCLDCIKIPMYSRDVLLLWKYKT